MQGICLAAEDESGANPIDSATLYGAYSTPVIRWPFQPVVDYQYVLESPTQQWRDGHFNKVPVLTVGSQTHRLQ
jgi:hypothetical protein